MKGATCTGRFDKTGLPIVRMTRAEFDLMPAYDCSMPTGTTIGKRWTRSWPYRNPTKHYVSEFIEHPDPTRVGIWTERVEFIAEDA